VNRSIDSMRDLHSSSEVASDARRMVAAMMDERNASNHTSGSLTVRRARVTDDEMVRPPPIATGFSSIDDDCFCRTSESM